MVPDPEARTAIRRRPGTHEAEGIRPERPPIGPVIAFACMLACEMTFPSGSNLEAREITIAGRHLCCQVCEFTRFFRREAELSTGASFFGQDWANPKADVLRLRAVRLRPLVRPHAVGRHLDGERGAGGGDRGTPRTARSGLRGRTRDLPRLTATSGARAAQRKI